MTRDSELLAWVAAIIKGAQDRGEYAEVRVKLEAGRIVHAERRESLKPPRSG